MSEEGGWREKGRRLGPTGFEDEGFEGVCFHADRIVVLVNSSQVGDLAYVGLAAAEIRETDLAEQGCERGLVEDETVTVEEKEAVDYSGARREIGGEGEAAHDAVEITLVGGSIGVGVEAHNSGKVGCGDPNPAAGAEDAKRFSEHPARRVEWHVLDHVLRENKLEGGVGEG
jgi:hypothetical protein